MTPSNTSPLYKNADKKSMYAILLLLLTIAIWFFLTTSLYSTYATSSEEKTGLDTRIESLREEVNVLNKKKDQVSNDKSTREAIAQFASQYREDLILNQIYAKFDWVLVQDINMDKWQKLPNGLNLAWVSISVTAKNLTELNKYLTYLTDKTSNIRFVIKSVSFPLNSENTSSAVSASISLGMYYFEQ